MDSDLKAVEDAEVRLESRSQTRREQLQKRDRRRRLAPWLICLVPLPALGAGALLAIIGPPAETCATSPRLPRSPSSPAACWRPRCSRAGWAAATAGSTRCCGRS